MERPVCLFGTMCNIKNPFSTIYLCGKVCLSFWHYEQHQKTLLHHLPNGKVSLCPSFGHYGQHQKPFLHRLPQWKGLSVFLALWATSKTLSPPSTSVERPVCLFGTMATSKTLSPPSTSVERSVCLSFWHYEQHQKTLLHHLPNGKVSLSVFLALWATSKNPSPPSTQWKGQSVSVFWALWATSKTLSPPSTQWKGRSVSIFWALWATSKTLSPPSTSMERPVCLFGTMGNIRIPFSTIYPMERSVCVRLLGTTGTIKNPFSTVYLSGKVCLSIFSGTSGFYPIARTGIFFDTCGFHSITKS